MRCQACRAIWRDAESNERPSDELSVALRVRAWCRGHELAPYFYCGARGRCDRPRFLPEEILDVDVETRLLEFCGKAVLHLVNAFVELDVDKTCDIGWQFEVALMQNCYALSS